jgi:hypothetical protein
MVSEGHHQTGKIARIPTVLAFLQLDVKLKSYENFSEGSDGPCSCCFTTLLPWQLSSLAWQAAGNNGAEQSWLLPASLRLSQPPSALKV